MTFKPPEIALLENHPKLRSMKNIEVYNQNNPAVKYNNKVPRSSLFKGDIASREMRS